MSNGRETRRWPPPKMPASGSRWTGASSSKTEPHPTYTELNMTTTIKLTDTQHHVLTHAADQADGRLTWFPEGVKGGARQKVIAGLFNKSPDHQQRWQGLVCRGRGLRRPGARTTDTPAAIHPTRRLRPPCRRLRPTGRKKSRARQKVCSRSASRANPVREQQAGHRDPDAAAPRGPPSAQICAATGWQAHTVRGTFAGAFKKKLGAQPCLREARRQRAHLPDRLTGTGVATRAAAPK